MPGGGAVLFAGDVMVDGSHVAWQEGVAADELLDSDWSTALKAVHWRPPPRWRWTPAHRPGRV